MKIFKNKKAQTTKIGQAIKQGLIPLTILAIAIFIFGGKLTWEIATNIRLIAYVIGGIVALKLLSLLGFRK